MAKLIVKNNIGTELRIDHADNLPAVTVTSAEISPDKGTIASGTAFKLRRGTTSEHSGFTGADGEVTLDTDKGVVVVHDGATAGGVPLATEAKTNELTASLANKATISYVDSVTGALASGSPSGVYTDIAALTAAIPAGNSNIYVTSGDGNWNYWSGSAWVAGGQYLTGSLDHATTADVASVATGAGFEPASTTFSAPWSNTEVIDPGIGQIKQYVKTANTDLTVWIGYRIRIDFNTLSDLNKIFYLEHDNISGLATSDFKILKGTTDWNPANWPVYISSYATQLSKGGDGVNLYDIVSNSSYAAEYEAQGFLYIATSLYNPDNTYFQDKEVVWEFNPYFQSAVDVVASKVNASLNTQLSTQWNADISTAVDEVAYDVDKVKGNIVLSKQHILSYGYAKSPATNYTATVNSFTDFDGNIVTRQFDLHNPDGGYAYTYLKIFNDYTTEAAGKKVRFYIRASQECEAHLRLTNGTAWGSSSGNTGSYAGFNDRIYNAENNYTQVFEYDYSSQAAYDWYNNPSYPDRSQSVWYIVAQESSAAEATATPTTFTVYSYIVDENGQELATDSSPYVVSNELLARSDAYTDLNLAVSTAQAGVDANTSDIITINSTLDGLLPPTKIVCWGDSLTAGGGWTSTLASLSGLTVYNGGTGGENSRTILARQGGDVMITNNVTIPADTSEILIADRDVDGGIKTEMGYTVLPLLQGGAHVNPCYLGDVEGTLRWTGTNYADMTGNWVWKRNTAGSQIVIDRPTALRTNFDMVHNDAIQVIFIGQNGGWSDLDELVRQHRWMMAHSTVSDDKTVILGLSSGSAALRADYEARMKQEFGRYFISLREYLAAPIYDVDGVTIINCYGLADAGLTPTQADLDAIATGTVPPQCLSDSVHYTSATKTVIGNMLYKRMRDLNIFM